MSHNVSYGAGANSLAFSGTSQNVTAEIGTAEEISEFAPNNAYSDIFVEQSMSELGLTACGGATCYVGCTCNTANGWYASATDTGSDSYVSVKSRRAYARGVDGSQQATPQEVTCYHEKIETDCPDDYFCITLSPKYRTQKYDRSIDFSYSGSDKPGHVMTSDVFMEISTSMGSSGKEGKIEGVDNISIDAIYGPYNICTTDENLNAQGRCKGTTTISGCPSHIDGNCAGYRNNVWSTYCYQYCYNVYGGDDTWANFPQTVANANGGAYPTIWEYDLHTDPSDIKGIKVNLNPLEFQARYEGYSSYEIPTDAPAGKPSSDWNVFARPYSDITIDAGTEMAESLGAVIYPFGYNRNIATYSDVTQKLLAPFTVHGLDGTTKQYSKLRIKVNTPEALPACNEGYFYYTDVSVKDTNVYNYEVQSDNAYCLKPTCKQITMYDPDGNKFFINAAGAKAPYNGEEAIETTDYIARGHDVLCYPPKWPTHLVYNFIKYPKVYTSPDGVSRNYDCYKATSVSLFRKFDPEEDDGLVDDKSTADVFNGIFFNYDALIPGFDNNNSSPHMEGTESNLKLGSGYEYIEGLTPVAEVIGSAPVPSFACDTNINAICTDKNVKYIIDDGYDSFWGSNSWCLLRQYEDRGNVSDEDFAYTACPGASITTCGAFSEYNYTVHPAQTSVTLNLKDDYLEADQGTDSNQLFQTSVNLPVVMKIDELDCGMIGKEWRNNDQGNGRCIAQNVYGKTCYKCVDSIYFGFAYNTEDEVLVAYYLAAGSLMATPENGFGPLTIDGSSGSTRFPNKFGEAGQSNYAQYNIGIYNWDAASTGPGQGIVPAETSGIDGSMKFDKYGRTTAGTYYYKSASDISGEVRVKINELSNYISLTPKIIKPENLQDFIDTSDVVGSYRVNITWVKNGSTYTMKGMCPSRSSLPSSITVQSYKNAAGSTVSVNTALTCDGSYHELTTTTSNTINAADIASTTVLKIGNSSVGNGDSFRYNDKDYQLTIFGYLETTGSSFNGCDDPVFLVHVTPSDSNYQNMTLSYGVKCYRGETTAPSSFSLSAYGELDTSSNDIFRMIGFQNFASYSAPVALLNINYTNYNALSGSATATIANSVSSTCYRPCILNGAGYELNACSIYPTSTTYAKSTDNITLTTAEGTTLTMPVVLRMDPINSTPTECGY